METDVNGLARAFSEHPQSVGETYFEHLGAATRFSGGLALASAACLIHGLLPFLFVSTGSRQVRRLHDAMITHRRRVEQTPFRQTERG